MIEYRRYASYEDYIKHQRSKLEKKEQYFAAVFDERYKLIYGRVEKLVKELNKGVALCLGARMGEEVKAFMELGFKGSVGIDLNPGKENPYVIEGDFHKIPFDDNSFDLAYTNCLDHVFDLQKVAEEIRRVIKPAGHLILEVSNSNKLTRSWRNKQGRKHIETSSFESMIWDNIDDVLSRFKEPDFTLINKVLDPNYLGFVFRLS